MKIDVIILTRDEEANLPYALRSVRGWTGNVFVVDSGSTDRTVEIAQAMGAKVVQRPWLGYARQKNWALENLPFESPWVLIVDADEAVLPELRSELAALASRPIDQVREAGFYVNRYLIFEGRRIRYCGYYPSWNLRFFKRGLARYEDRVVHEHMIVEGACGYLRGHLEHHDRRGPGHYAAKHEQYAALEAQAILGQGEGEGAHLEAKLIGTPVERRRWIKCHVYPHLPARWLWRWVYMYGLRLGFLDGRAGWRLCAFMAGYERAIGREMKKVRSAKFEVGRA